MFEDLFSPDVLVEERGRAVEWVFACPEPLLTPR